MRLPSYREEIQNVSKHAQFVQSCMRMRIFQQECWGNLPGLPSTSEASVKMSVGKSPGRKAVLQCTSDLTSLLKQSLLC